MSGFEVNQRLGASLPTLPEEQGPIETLPGRNAEPDRVREGISEGLRLAETERVVPGGAEAFSLWLLGICEFESIGSLEHAPVARRNDN
jgi:hypothetical protein